MVVGLGGEVEGKGSDPDDPPASGAERNVPPLPGGRLPVRGDDGTRRQVPAALEVVVHEVLEQEVVRLRSRDRPDVVHERAQHPRAGHGQEHDRGAEPPCRLGPELRRGRGREGGHRTGAPDHRPGTGWRQECGGRHVSEPGRAPAAREVGHGHDGQDRPGDEVPVRGEVERDDRLDVEDVGHVLLRADAEADDVLERDADQVGDRVLGRRGQFLVGRVRRQDWVPGPSGRGSEHCGETGGDPSSLQAHRSPFPGGSSDGPGEPSVS